MEQPDQPILSADTHEVALECWRGDKTIPQTQCPVQMKAQYGYSIVSGKMVLLERFELSASPLPRECSTPEL